MIVKREFGLEEAKAVGGQLGLDWMLVDAEQFRIGLAIELEHGGITPQTKVTNENLLVTGKIILAHLNEFPDYYTRLKHLEEEAEEFWEEGRT